MVSIKKFPVSHLANALDYYYTEVSTLFLEHIEWYGMGK